MAESKKRSITKTISWRVLATLTTMMLVFIFTGDLSLMVGVGFFEVILKMIIYYFHERTWDKILWGKSILVDE